MKGRTKPYTDDDKALLRQLIESFPLSTRGEICDKFARKTGRKISVATLNRITRPDRERLTGKPVEAPDSVPTARVGNHEALSDDHRKALVRILRDHSDATDRRIVILFRHATKRKISIGGIRHARKNIERYATADRSFRFLSDAQRETLRRIIAESDHDTPSSEIIRMFTEETGRSYTERSVRKFRRNILGLPGVGQGKNSRIGREAAGVTDRQIQVASTKKLDSAPVDRSIRVGRSGRYQGTNGSTE